jgi:hypothetical protein
MTHAQDLRINYINVNRFEWLHILYINDKIRRIGGCNISDLLDLHVKWLLKLFNMTQVQSAFRGLLHVYSQ